MTHKTVLSYDFSSTITVYLSIMEVKEGEEMTGHNNQLKTGAFRNSIKETFLSTIHYKPANLLLPHLPVLIDKAVKDASLATSQSQQLSKVLQGKLGIAASKLLLVEWFQNM